MTALLHAFDTSFTKIGHDTDPKILPGEISHYLTHVSGHFSPLAATTSYGIIINKGTYELIQYFDYKVFT